MRCYLGIFCMIFILASCASFEPNDTFESESRYLRSDAMYAQYFGASTLYFNDGLTSFFIDGFITRPSIKTNLLGGIESDYTLIEQVLKETKIEKLNAVIVAHGHYDHALDSANVAKAKESRLIASLEVKELYPAFDQHRFEELTPFNSIGIDDFQIIPIPTPHINKSLPLSYLEKLYMSLSCGPQYLTNEQGYSFLIKHPQANILVVPSANFPKNFTVKIDADIVFLSVGLLSNRMNESVIVNGDEGNYIEEYWRWAVLNTGAKKVYLIHWDNLQGISAKELSPPPAILDNIQKAIGKLKTLAEKGDEDGRPISISLPPLKDPFSIEF